MASAPLDLLEHTYGPGTRPLDLEALSPVEALLRALTCPSAVEVTHPPGYHWLLGALGGLGDDEWLLRLPALAASLATVAVAWLLVRRLRPSAGLLAAGLLAVAAPAVHFGRDATPYALLSLVAVGSVELLLRALERGSGRAWRLWAGALALGFLCHYSTALFGLAEAGAVVVMAAVRVRRTAWPAALHRAAGAAMVVAPLPLLWCFVHFAWYDPVALDTRLFADVYPEDPGLGPFASAMTAVATGVGPEHRLAAAALATLALAGLAGAWRRDRELGLVLLAVTAAFAGGTVFFHANLVAALGGRVFWGFRWVSWAVPLLLSLAALGAVGPPGARPAERAVRGALLVLWAAFALPFAARLPDHSTRPDYRAAADHVLADLRDGDALATLPLWGQRGPMTWYLARRGDGRLVDVDGVPAWRFGDAALFAEATAEGLPFESSARSAWFDRLWVVVVDERMFGRPKFDLEVADRAVAWAERRMLLQDSWEGRGIRVYRFGRRPGELAWSPPSALVLRPAAIDPTSVPWLAPGGEPCAAEEEGMEPRWRLDFRVPLRGVQPELVARDGALSLREAPGHIAGRMDGGPCTGTPPELRLLPR